MVVRNTLGTVMFCCTCICDLFQ